MSDREPISIKDLPSNSRFKTTTSLDEGKNEPEKKKKKVEKVIDGTVERKKSVGRLLKEIFFAEDIVDVKNYVLQQVIFPSIRQGLADICVRSANMLFLGETDGGRDSSDKVYRSYSGYYDQKKNRKEREHKDENSRKLLPDDIMFRTRSDAEKTLDALIDITEGYDVASVMDFFQLVGEIGEVVDDKFGWYKEDLRMAKVRAKNKGFYIDLPRPVSLS